MILVAVTYPRHVLIAVVLLLVMNAILKQINRKIKY